MDSHANPAQGASNEIRLPLLPSQLQFWLIDRVAPDRPQPMRIFLRLSGELNVEALELALQTLVHRHEALRVVFEVENGHTWQVIKPPQFQLEFEDLSSSLSQKETLSEIAGEVTGESFDLEKGPLFRARLIRLGERDHVLLVASHHIVCDGWSKGLLSRELSSLYGTFSENFFSRLSSPSLSYSEYVTRFTESLSSARLAQGIDYWKRKLEGISPKQLLPLDSPRSQTPSFLGSTYQFDIPTRTSKRVKEIARSEKVTLFTALLAAFKILLRLYSDQEDLVVLTPTSGRNSKDAELLVGLFVNTLVLRTELTGQLSIREALIRTRDTVLDAYDHQFVPFETLVSTLGLHTSPGVPPISYVLFQLLPGVDSPTFPGLLARPYAHKADWVRLDLEVNVIENRESLTVSLRYRTDLFSRSTIEQIGLHFQNVIDATFSDLSQRLSDISLISKKERERKIDELNAVRVEFLSEKSVVELFHGQARKTPTKVAIESGPVQTTYRDLDLESDKLARYLSRKGLKRGDIAGILMDRCEGMIIALLAVLKTGAAYLPLDPSYPQSRIGFMIEDAGAQVVVTQESLKSLINLPLDVIYFDLVGDEIGSQQEQKLEIAPSLDDLAYIIYTSGSTGSPKGVEICHRGLTNLALSQITIFQITQNDRVLQFAPFSFDASVSEIFTSLLSGATLVIPERSSANVGAELFETLSKKKISVATLPPSALRTLPRGSLPTLKTLITAGESCPPDLANAWNKVTRLLNAYGPTESTVCATIGVCSGHYESPPPIGRPIPNIQVYILDRKQEIVPTGIVGEIFIAGVGLARGYRGRPELTSQSFVPNPFNSSLGTRMYRTGDLGRFLPDGSIEFRGRVDTQLKVRGYRVEPGEVESALVGTGLVDEAAVVPRKDFSSSFSLFACVVPAKIHAQPEHTRSDEERHIERWRQTLEASVDQSDEGLASDFSGWKSTYTDLPIPREEMEEWVNRTLSRLGRLRPRKVLEIGCGTGLLALPLVPTLDQYIGTDFSSSVTKRLQQRLERLQLAAKSKIYRREASDFTGIEGTFDLVLLNSVVQFFPGPTYLERVLEIAISKLSPTRSQIFVGDIRSLPLHEAFAVSVEASRLGSSSDLGSLYLRAHRRLLQERELLIHPRFFENFAARHPEILHVEVLPKRGRSVNELTRFRYDVVLQLGESQLLQPPDWITWTKEGLTLEALMGLLRGAPEVVALRGIPNARLAGLIEAASFVQRPGNFRSIQQIRRLQEAQHDGAVDVEDLHEVGTRMGYRVSLNWSAHERGEFHAVLAHKDSDISNRQFSFNTETTTDNVNMTNDPLSTDFSEVWRLAKSKLRSKLPDYMIPTSVSAVSRLPMTAAGKVDRGFLRGIDPLLAETSPTTITPQTQSEEMVATIWSEALQTSVTSGDNFFEMGGHSLLGTYVMTKLSAAFNFDLDVRLLFKFPTVQELARAIDIERTTLQIRPQNELHARLGGNEIPVSPSQHWMIVLNRLRGASSFQMHAAKRLAGGLDIVDLESAISAVVQRHESLRTTFRRNEGEFVQIIHPQLELKIALEDFSHLPRRTAEREAHRYGKDQASSVINIFGHDSLIRLGLVQLDNAEHVLFITIPEVVCDAASLYLLLWEIEYFYNCFRQGQKPAVEPLEVQYADYSLWQRSQLEGEHLNKSLRYWEEKLLGMRGPNLPVQETSHVSKTSGSVQSIGLAPDLVKGLRENGRTNGATLFMTLLGIFKLVLTRITGQTDLTIGTVVANRSHYKIENVIGFFANTVALRTKFSLDDSLTDFLHEVRRTTLDALIHQDVPFHVLLRELDTLNRPEVGTTNVLFQLVQPLGYAARSSARSGWMTSFYPSSDDPHPLSVRTGADLEWRVTLGSSGGGLVRAFYQRRLFKDKAIADWLQMFAQACHLSIENPQVTIGTLISGLKMSSH